MTLFFRQHVQISKVILFLCPFFLLQAVLKGGAISGSFMNSGNVRCGTSVCRPISGVFAKNPLQNGYIHVVTIPAGASNITITELRNSINFLGISFFFMVFEKYVIRRYRRSFSYFLLFFCSL